MTFSDGSNYDSNRVQKRSGGRTTAVAGGGVVALLAALFGILTGTNVIDLGGSSDQPATSTGTDCTTAEQANTDDECRYVATITSLDRFWGSALPEQTGVQYTRPQAVSFVGQTATPCGTASAATGPFYCPADETVYLDVGFFDQLGSQYGGSTGPLAQEYVVAHEVGHHVQQITGVMGTVDRSGTGADSGSVRVELMADCLAGMWAKGASQPGADGTADLEPLTKQDIADALSAASAVGDDRIQKESTGYVDPESWTHGSSAQRQSAFVLGYQGGSYQTCARILTDRL